MVWFTELHPWVAAGVLLVGHASSLGFRVQGSGLRVQVLGFRVRGFGFRV